MKEGYNMINIKEYVTHKIVAKTAKKNNLTLGNKESLFDFTLLDALEIPETVLY